MCAAKLAREVPGAPAKAALDACLADLQRPAPGVLALVLEVAGHAYAKAGSLVHIGADGQRCGWLSPGCLEDELLDSAAASCSDARPRLLELDNRDLADVFSGSGAGCRGRQRVLLLPLANLPGLQAVLAAYRGGRSALSLRLSLDDGLRASCAGRHGHWPLPLAAVPEVTPHTWQLQLAPLPRLLVCGAGPESALLLPLLDQLGWCVDLLESRPAWAHCAAWVEQHLKALPASAEGYDAVLLMAHHFGYDRDALEAVAGWPQLPPYIGLLGPATRRSDLLATLSPAQRARLQGQVESPAGLPLGGRGPAAIALSLAARLQALAGMLDPKHGRMPSGLPDSPAIPNHEPPPC